MPSATRGAYLYSLEPELFPTEDLASHADLVSQAILISALFSQHACLTDAQVFVTEGVRTFFRKNEHALFEMIDEREEPIIRIALRKTGDIWGSLDLRLEPKGEKGYPSYDNSLTAAQNDRVRRGYRRLRSAARRRERFFEAAGHEFRDHVERLERYITKSPEGTIHAEAERLAEPLYAAVKREIELLQRSRAITPGGIDESIACKVLERISKHAKSEVQTREALHWTVYGGQSPRYIEARWTGPNTQAPPSQFARFRMNGVTCSIASTTTIWPQS